MLSGNSTHTLHAVFALTSEVALPHMPHCGHSDVWGRGMICRKPKKPIQYFYFVWHKTLYINFGPVFIFYCCCFTETKAAVTDPHTEGIEYIDEHVDGENNNIDRDEETKSDLDEDSDKERDEDPGALHINRVNLRKGPRENERARLRVCVEITHPALKLPVYRTWTGETNEQIKQSLHHEWKITEVPTAKKLMWHSTGS